MNTTDDLFWASIAPVLRKAAGFEMPDIATMEAELDAIEGAPISESKVDERVEAALTGIVRPRRWSTEQPEEADESFGSIRDEALQLNRNLGEDDAEIEDFLEQQRREALGDGLVQEGESDPAPDEGAEPGGGSRAG